MALIISACMRLEYLFFFFFNFEFYLPNSHCYPVHLVARYGVDNLGPMSQSLLFMTLLGNSKWKKSISPMR